MKTIGLVAGPCSAESRKQMLETARGLKEMGVGILRAGLWKPRSRCGTFEGVGEEGLDWMREIQQELGLRVMTEVALPCHVEAVRKAGLDMIWIGARTTVNPFMMHELAESLRGCDMPVWVKNPVCPDVDLWIGAVERLQQAGLKDIRIIHRGFCTVDSSPYRNAPLWELAERFHTHFPDLPFYCDPSHIGGKRELIAPLCQQAMDLNFDGLIVESHCNPDCAWSDASQQVTPDVLDYILNLLVIRTETQTTESLSQLRKQIDECDDNIIQELAKRMRIAREIGTYKKEHGITVLQAGRYNEILEKRGAQGEQCGMDAEFMKKIFEAIHEESVRQQMEIINK